jgi:hypothetical protein
MIVSVVEWPIELPLIAFCPAREPGQALVRSSNFQAARSRGETDFVRVSDAPIMMRENISEA